MRALIAILTLLFVTVVIGVMLLNASETVTLRLWWDTPGSEADSYELPLGVVILGAIAMGFLFTGIVAIVEGLMIRLENRRLTRTIRELRRELDELRTPAIELPPDTEPAGEEIS